MTPRTVRFERWARARLAAVRLALAERRYNETWLASAAGRARAALDKMIPSEYKDAKLPSKKPYPGNF